MTDVPALEGPKKKSAMIILIAALAGLTLVAGGGGWLVGTMVAPKVKNAEDAQKAAAEAAQKKKDAGKKGEGDLPKLSAIAGNIVQLDPITTNLAYPSENWVRLEVALVFNGPVDAKLAEEIHQDILAYMRTVSLQQIEGPRGFDYLKDDLQERVDLRSQGRVSRLMFRTFVIE
ncbi:flagellar basal body-associated FliL family protein [Allorhizobium sp. BGMRC 0089]|uniref:flagellar basal body-associated FliL family protein n=1 Tax=Allorhizobium sonneratiae TaxID=2934936 RepID=UPI0020344186|nr:flagellar basal body-associated FliL family protein [Allorhizobium sonneratiae]MCM2291395.1 flagellar basal body-associated FliL family protein [Allorhizobium sonneratiae]